MAELASRTDTRDRHNALFYCTLAYLAIFYSQIGGRIPALGKVRIELLLGALLLVAIFHQIASGTVRLGNNRVIKGGFLFFLAIMFSLPVPLFQHTLSEALEALIRLLKFAAIFVMIVATVDTERKLKWFIYCYVACISFIIVESFLNGIAGREFYSVDHVMRLHGPTGLFAHPNSLGGVTTGTLPFLYFLFIYERKVWKKLIIIALGVMAMLVIVWTGSRTAWVGTLALMGFLWWYSKQKVLMAVAGCICLVVVWSVTPPEMQERFLTLRKTAAVVTDTEYVSSMSARWLLIKDGWSIFLDYPITGVGIECFQAARFRKFSRWQMHHNMYLQALTDMGLVGFFAFGYLVFGIIKNLRESRANLVSQGDREFMPIVCKAVHIFLLTRLVVGLFGGDLYENYWWIAGGLSFVIWRLAQKEAPCETPAIPQKEAEQLLPKHGPSRAARRRNNLWYETD